MCIIFLFVLNVCKPHNILDFWGNYVNRKIYLIKKKKKAATINEEQFVRICSIQWPVAWWYFPEKFIIIGLPYSKQNIIFFYINCGFIQIPKFTLMNFIFIFWSLIYIYIYAFFTTVGVLRTWHGCCDLSNTVFRAILSVKFSTIILSKCFPWIILHVSPFPSSENWNIIHLLTLSIN